jgi:hypothetical protein
MSCSAKSRAIAITRPPTPSRASQIMNAGSLATATGQNVNMTGLHLMTPLMKGKLMSPGRHYPTPFRQCRRSPGLFPQTRSQPPKRLLVLSYIIPGKFPDRKKPEDFPQFRKMINWTRKHLHRDRILHYQKERSCALHHRSGATARKIFLSSDSVCCRHYRQPGPAARQQSRGSALSPGSRYR